MSDKDEKKEPTDGSFAALLGEPTGDSLTRNRLENLSFSTKQQHRPDGQSRADYISGDPGRLTGRFVREAGLGHRHRRAVVTAILSMTALAGLLWGVWWLVNR